MARPVYETKSNIDRERVAAKIFGDGLGLEMVKLKTLYQFDYAAREQKEIRAFVEIKCRSFESTKYPTYMISADKAWRAMNVTAACGIPVYLVVVWTDCIGSLKLKAPFDFPVKLGGRRDRGDVQDVEPCYFIPIECFTINRLE